MFLNVGRNPEAAMSGSVRQPSPVFLQNPCAGIPAKANRASTSPAQPIFADGSVLLVFVAEKCMQNLSKDGQVFVFRSVGMVRSPHVFWPERKSFLSQL